MYNKLKFCAWQLLICTICLSSCQRALILTPREYLASPDTRRTVVVRMDNAVHVTLSDATLDSLNLVNRVLSRGLANKKTRVVVILYSSVGGPLPYGRAIAAGYGLKSLLKEHGFDTARIEVASYVSSDSYASTSLYKAIDFVFEENSKPLKYYRETPYRKQN